MTKTRTFDDFYAEVMQLYGDRKYAEVADLLAREGENYPDNAYMVLYLQSCMAARLGDNEQAITFLRDAHARGIWYGEATMRQSPSWANLQGNPGFEDMAAVFAQEAKTAYVGPHMRVTEPEGGCNGERACPAVLTLHGNGANGLASLRGWEPLAELGWLQASLQSSQVIATESFVWDDQEKAISEVAAHYADLLEKYNIDKSRVILAGFSMGGETALRAALLGTVPVEGFILLGPGGPGVDEPEGWLPLMEEARNAGRNLRGYVFLGEEDGSVDHDAIRKMVALLNENGIPCELEGVPGTAHEYPRDFAERIARAIAFVEQ